MEKHFPHFNMASVIEAKCLPDDGLPTKLQIYQHYLYILKAKSESGEWSQKHPMRAKAEAVLLDVADKWNKTSIPHDLHDRKVVENVLKLIKRDGQIRAFIRHPKSWDEIVAKFGILFDVAKCKCIVQCTCSPEN